MARKLSWFVVVAFVTGLMARLYLAWTLPVWLDERVTLESVEPNFGAIASDKMDKAHPPGYFWMVKVMTYLGKDLIVLRMSSVGFFVVNCLLLLRLGERWRDAEYGRWLVILYALSGYFVAFDWQLRMYSGTVMLMLASLWMLSLSGKDKRVAWIFGAINIVGVIYDYSFWWYFAGLNGFLFYRWIKTGDKHLLLANVGAVGAAWVLVLGVWDDLPMLSKGLGWVANTSRPDLVVTYLLGSHRNLLATIIFMAWTGWSGYKLVEMRGASEGEKVLGCSSACALGAMGVYSLVISPMVHVRMLQVVGLLVIMVMAYGLWRLRKIQKVENLYVLIGVLLLINLVIVVRLHFTGPGWLLIKY